MYQGYHIGWTEHQFSRLQNIIKNINSNWYYEYCTSSYYQPHNDQNSVPGLAYQIELAAIVGKELSDSVGKKLQKFISAHAKT